MTDDNFKINLQLFAEEGESAPVGDSAESTPSSAESTADTTDTSTDTDVSTDSGESNQTETSDGDIALVTDKQTGLKRIISVHKEEQQEPESPEEPETKEPETGDDTVQPETKEPESKPLIDTEPYDLDQLNKAIIDGSVNESRIPAQYQMQYTQYRQQQAQQQAKIRAQQAQQQQAQQQAMAKQQANVIEQINSVAYNKALSDLGLKKEDIDMAEYSDDDETKSKAAKFRTAVDWNRSQIIGNMQRQQMQQENANNQRHEVYQSITNFVDDKRTSEPHFAEIDKLMSTYYKELPYKDAENIANVINNFNKGNITYDQCKVLEKYYNDTRVHYYGQKNDLTKTPKKIPVPKVEKPGNGATSKPKAFDFSSLRSMNDNERRAALHKYWSNK